MSAAAGAPAPGRILPLGAAFVAVARLHARVAFGPRRLVLPLAAGIVMAAGGLAARLAGQRPITTFDFITRWGELAFFPALCGLLLAAGAWGLEVEARTLTYLFLRPVRRPVLVLGKLGAVATLSAALVAASTTLLYLATWSGPGGGLAAGLPYLARALAAGTLGAIAFTALLGTLGVAFGARAFTAASAYLLGVELALGTSSTGARYLSIAHHLRSVAGLNETPSALGPAASALLVLALAGAWLAAGMLLAGAKEHERGSASE